MLSMGICDACDGDGMGEDFGGKRRYLTLLEILAVDQRYLRHSTLLGLLALH
jgi:hypothetical protein